jgi:ABC-type phosphate transport system substrate-binding protein
MKKNLLGVAVSLALTSICSMAYADLVVVVNAKNTASVTKDQITQSFLGSTNTFSPIDQPDGSPIRNEFYKTVAEKDPSQVRAIWSKLVFTGKAKPPKQFANSEEVKKEVAGNMNAIGYIEKSAVDSSVRVVYPAN